MPYNKKMYLININNININNKYKIIRNIKYNNLL